MPTPRQFYWPEQDYFTFQDVVNANPHLVVKHFKQSSIRHRLRQYVKVGRVRIIDVVWVGSHRHYVYALAGKGQTYQKPPAPFLWPNPEMLFTFATFHVLNPGKKLSTLRGQILYRRWDGKVKKIGTVDGHESLYIISPKSCAFLNLTNTDYFSLQDLVALNKNHTQKYVYQTVRKWINRGLLKEIGKLVYAFTWRGGSYRPDIKCNNAIDERTLEIDGFRFDPARCKDPKDPFRFFQSENYV
jgi:hypothetical protein